MREHRRCVRALPACHRKAPQPVTCPGGWFLAGFRACAGPRIAVMIVMVREIPRLEAFAGIVREILVPAREWRADAGEVTCSDSPRLVPRWASVTRVGAATERRRPL